MVGLKFVLRMAKGSFWNAASESLACQDVSVSSFVAGILCQIGLLARFNHLITSQQIRSFGRTMCVCV